MTQAAQKLLEEFDALQEAIRPRSSPDCFGVATAPHDLPDPDGLVAAADEIFVELDRRERSQ